MDSMLYASMYLEVNIICLIVLFVVLFKCKTSMASREEVTVFRYVVVLFIAVLFLDCIWMLGNANIVSLPVPLNRAINALYFAVTGLSGYFWLVYAEYKLGKDRMELVNLISIIPLSVYVVICIASAWTGWVFYVDDAGVYFRGPYYLIQPIILFAFVGFSTVHNIICGLREKNLAKRKDDFILSSFIILPIIGLGLQIFVSGIPSSTAGCALSVLIVFINFQESLISCDTLTGLNNRRRTDEYLSSRVSGIREKQSLTYYIIDVNRFKLINDTYGHAEGDKALKNTASALTSVCGKRDCFISRIGGDEFCIIIIGDSDKTKAYGSTIIDELNISLKNICASQKKPYILSVSAGSCTLSEKNDTPAKLYSEADKALYTEKQKLSK